MKKPKELDDIATTDKEEFLIFEKRFFHWRKYENFVKYMEQDAVPCKRCGVYYWNRCKKRCKHK